MHLVVTEKHDAAQKIADLLSSSKPKADKVYSTPIYRFEVDGDEWVTIGLRGHILEPDFVESLVYKQRKGWLGHTSTGEDIPAEIPDALPKPPFKKRRPFTADGVDMKGWKMDALPYLVYAPIEMIPKEKDIIRSLKNLAAKADTVIIATDFDREGELIGSDALGCIKQVNDTAPVYRARYSAFTKAEITNAFRNLVRLDDDLAEAGGSRRDIDLIWGAALTRYLTLAKFAGYGNVRSSGRVQTPTLALVVEREKERMAFVPEDYWVIKGTFGEEGDTFEGTHAAGRFKSAEEAQKVMDAVEGEAAALVREVEKKQRKAAPPVPFNTTSLMAAASAEGIAPARTMRIAESLYMRGLISYPRVDNTVYPKSLDLAETVRTISANPAYAKACADILSKPIHATRGKTETTDHPPIYPTAAATSDTLSAADYKLYNLIARRFLATLMDAAVLEGTKAVLEVGGEDFIAKGDVTLKPGYRSIYPYGLKKDEQLPVLQEGTMIPFWGATCEQKQTEPPARYSQGKLVQEMEKLGLGTKSTRASIIERLYEVKYIQNDPIEPSALGIAVIDALGKFAPHITHPEMTAQLEVEMDAIANGKVTRGEVVANSRDLLAEQIDVLIPHREEVKEALSDAASADAYIGKCPKCGRDLQIRSSSKTRGTFVGCAGWPECDVTYPLPKGKIEAVEEPCPTCGMAQIKVTAFRSKPKTQCIDPNCPTNQEPDVEVGPCPVCAAAGRQDGVLIASRNPRTLKRSIRCTNFDICRTSHPLPQHGTLKAADEICEHCGTPKVIVTTSRGPWNLCPNYDCPGKAEGAKSGSRGKRGAGRKGAAKGSKDAKSAKGTKGAAKGSTRGRKGSAKGTAEGTSATAATDES